MLEKMNFAIKLLTMIKRYLGDILENIIHTNNVQVKKLRVASKNAITKERNQKIEKELKQQLNYVNSLNNIKQRYFKNTPNNHLPSNEMPYEAEFNHV